MIGSNNVDQARFEADKRSVYKHPLFSLLALLLEKCENATQGNEHVLPLSSSSSSVKTFDRYNLIKNDIEAFIILLEKENRPLLTNNLELDGLMVKALQVLRIHLLELEKVQDLCRDFCNRYISCLRGKLQSENLLRSEYPPEVSSAETNSPLSAITQDVSMSVNVFNNNNAYDSGSEIMGYNHNGHMSPCASSVESGSDEDSNDDDMSTASNNSYCGRQKRGVLPKSATGILRSWLFQHLSHPYPTEDEKRAMASQTNLTLLQVNNWFINARRRILQPMMDQVSDSCKSANLISLDTMQDKKCPEKKDVWIDDIKNGESQDRKCYENIKIRNKIYLSDEINTNIQSDCMP